MNVEKSISNTTQLSNASTGKRENISLLFLGYTRETAASTQASLIAADIAPRCRMISSEQEFKGSLAERSWDLMLLSSMQTKALDFYRAADIIKEFDKDLPLILFCDTLPDPEIHLALLEKGIQVACTANNEKLMVMYIYTALQSVKQRQRWRHCESRLEKAEIQLKALIDDSSRAICFIAKQEIFYANPRFIEVFGFNGQDQLNEYSFAELLSTAHRDFFFDEINQIMTGTKSTGSIGVEMIRSDSTRFHATLTLTPAVYNEIDAVEIDITQQSSNTEIFDDIDPVSGLLNQRAFARQLEQQLTLARKGGNDGFLFYIFLDGFESLNHNVGQEGINLLIGSVGRLLRGLISEPHTLARIDENIYIVLLADPHQETAKQLAHNICSVMSEMDLVDGNYHIQTTCSIGISIINESTPRSAELISRAESAARSLHLNERSGNGYCFFQLEHSKPVADPDAKAVQRVIDAITNNRFKLLFQPIVPLETEIKVTNYEIFLRLLAVDNTEISPSIFMSSIAEDNVLARMDMWVLEECIILMRQALDQNKRNRMFINVTGKTLKNKAILPWFAEQLRTLRLPADHFVFQISEVDALAAPVYYKAFCQALHKLQCLICLKHFGSTSESNYVLADTKVDFVKLDGSYLNELNQNSLSSAQLIEIIQPLKEKGIQLIAPMVEDTRQMSKLFRMGINMVQGHYLQPPQAEMNYDFFGSGDKD